MRVVYKALALLGIIIPILLTIYKWNLYADIGSGFSKDLEDNNQPSQFLSWTNPDNSKVSEEENSQYDKMNWHRYQDVVINRDKGRRQNGAVRKSTLTASKPKLILFGNEWWFGQYPFLRKAQKLCPKCIFTEDHQFLNVSDAVVFHGYTLPNECRPPYLWSYPLELTRKPQWPSRPTLSKPLTLTDKRPPNQIWVWFLLEAPDLRWNSEKLLRNYNSSIINWTMTYRSDSDIPMPYGQIISNQLMKRPSFEESWAFLPSDVSPLKTRKLYDETVMSIPTINDLKGRKTVAWISSNCRTPSLREHLVTILQKYIPVDTYGLCGELTCHFEMDKRIRGAGNIGIDCRIEISKKYKFYLAFENAICEDYVTEKYFDTLLTQMVPIVYGGANYSRISPKYSHINVNDFASFKELANYLKHLDKNPEEYLKYFEWKKHYWVKNNGFISGFCKLCDKVWASNITRKTYHNLQEWWYHRSDYKISGQRVCPKIEDFLFNGNLKNKDYFEDYN